MAARNLAKVWKAEMGVSQGGKAYHRGSIPAKFEILQYRENCYHTYYIFSCDSLVFLGSEKAMFHYAIQTKETFIYQSQVYLSFEIQFLIFTDNDPYFVGFQTLQL